jgi:ketosteroid isomerase-like protein
MSQANVERVRAIMPPDGTDLRDVFVESGAFSSGGLVADDATVRFVAPSAEVSDTGPEGFRSRWADWLEPWESYLMYTDDFVDRGDRVVALTRLRGVTRRDHVEMEHEAAAVFRFEGDTVVEIEFNLDREDALGE